MTRVQLFWTAYVGFGVLATIAELVIPARKLKYGKALPMDLVAFAVYQFAMVPAAAYVTDPLHHYVPVPTVVRGIAWPIRLVVFYLAADLGSYWMHRLMHVKHVWRIHRWHHSPTALYWLAGVRATIPQQILFNLPFVVFIPILAGAPLWVFAAMMVEGVFRNHWQHANIAWRSNWLELAIVTPRYHQIHHASDKDLHDSNFGSLFSLWDRLFRTYRNPDEHVPKKFGTGEVKRDPIQLMIGV